MTPVQELLAQEVEALRAVRATLDAEREALQLRAPDALLLASSAKAQAVAQAARLEQERREHSAGNPAGQSLADHGLLTELKRLAVECRHQNEANGLLIRGQRRRIEGSLNVLRGGRATPDTYGRDGETRLNRSSRTPLASY